MLKYTCILKNREKVKNKGGFKNLYIRAKLQKDGLYSNAEQTLSLTSLSLSLSLSSFQTHRSRVCDLVCAVLFVAMRCLGLFFGFDFSVSNLSVSGFVLLLQTRKHLTNPTPSTLAQSN